MKPKKMVVHCKKAEYDEYIGRGSQWGNCFTHLPYAAKDGVTLVRDRAEAIQKFEELIYSHPKLIIKIVQELRGKVLGCWCSPLACHGDVLAKIANAPLNYNAATEVDVLIYFAIRSLELGPQGYLWTENLIPVENLGYETIFTKGDSRFHVVYVLQQNRGQGRIKPYLEARRNETFLTSEVCKTQGLFEKFGIKHVLVKAKE